MYELTYIVNPNLSEQEVAAQTDKVRGFVNGLAGEIKNEKLGEKRRLAYPIKKHGLGYYVTLEFNLDPDKIDDLTKQIKFEASVLRHLLISADEKLKQAAQRPIIRKKRTVPGITKLPGEIKPEIKPEKVKIEEIDKKLEEILE